MKSPIIPLIFLLSSLAACSFPGVYKIPISQGNRLEQDKIDQLEIGQSMNQVQFLLGTPMLTDSLSTGRWDYVYSLKQGEKIYKDVHLVIHFDKNGKVTKIDNRRNQSYAGGKTPAEIKQLEVENPGKNNTPEPASTETKKEETKS